MRLPNTYSGASHIVIMRDGSLRYMTFVGSPSAIEYGERHRRVVRIETLRGTVEYVSDTEHDED